REHRGCTEKFRLVLGTANTSNDRSRVKMLAPFPDTAIIDVPSALARELFEAAERLPLYENKEFYSSVLQASVHTGVREACPDGFDWTVGLIKERIASWPYCVLLK